MSRGMTISADTRRSRQSKSLLRTNNVHNSLTLIRHTKVLETKIFHISLQLHHLRSGGCLLNETFNSGEFRSIFRGDIVVDGGEGTVGTSDYAGGEAKALKGLRRGDFVHEVAINVQ